MIRRLAGQTAVYGLSTIVPRLINYLLAPYLTYIALSQYEYGIMSYFYATIPFGLSMLSLGMENAFFKFSGKFDSAKEKLAVFNTCTSSITILSIIMLASVAVFQNSISNLFDQSFNPEIITIVAAIVAIDAVCSIPFARLREQQRSLRFSLLKAMSVVINVVLVVFFYTLLPLLKDNSMFEWMWVEGFGSGYVFVANLIASLITGLILFAQYRDFRLSIDTKMLKSILLFSIPLFISGFSGTANEFIDRQMMAILIDPKDSIVEIGIYTATLKIASLMVIFTQMYRYAAEPLFLSKMKSEDFKTNTAEVTKFFWIASMIIFLTITLFIDAFELIVSSNFRGGVHLVPILLIANILLGIQLNLSFWYKFVEKTHFALYITLVGLSVNVVFNLIFMKSMGFTSAAVAKALSMAAMVVVSYWLNRKYYPINYNLRRIGEYTLLTGALFVVGENFKFESVIVDNLFNMIMLFVFIGWATYRENIIKRIRQ